MRVVITVPAYNEEKTIGRVISGIKEVMDSTKYSYQVMMEVVIGLQRLQRATVLWFILIL